MANSQGNKSKKNPWGHGIRGGPRRREKDYLQSLLRSAEGTVGTVTISKK